MEKKHLQAQSQLHSCFYQGSYAKPTSPSRPHSWKPQHDANCQPGELETQGRACWAPEDKGRRKALEGGGVLPTSVVAWGQ